MLKFFRTYQKFFFIIVAFFVVVSFSFFGTFSTFVNQETRVEKKIAKALDGSWFTDAETADLIALTATDTQKWGVPNCLIDQVLEKELLQTGLASQLVERYFPVVQKDLEEKLAKVKGYHPYVHPEASFISLHEVWSRLSPAYLPAYTDLKEKQKSVSVQTFEQLSTLFQQQQSVPVDFLRKLLLYQVQQHPALRPDPSLERRDLSFCGFSTPSDWFGENFLKLASQVIINGAAEAKKSGFRVGSQEAYLDLLETARQGIEEKLRKQVTYEQAKNYLDQELHLLGLDEKRAVESWKKVLLFRQLFHSVGESVLLDPLLARSVSEFASKSAHVELFQLPKEFQLANFQELLQFQFYLEAVAPAFSKGVELPEQLLSAAEVEARVPSLVQNRYFVEFREVNLDELIQQVSIKETWDWESAEENWQSLEQAFAFLSKMRFSTSEERLSYLDTLQEKQRFSIDQFARKAIVNSDRERWEKAFTAAAPKKTWIVVHAKGSGELPFKGVEEQERLSLLLHESDSLLSFTEDGKHFYTIHVLERGKEKKLLSFAEAKWDQAFLQYVEKRELETYEEMKKKNLASLQKKGGAWKSFAESKDEVGAYLFAALMRSIEKEEKRVEGSQPFSFYSSHRFARYVRQAQEALKQDAHNPLFIRENEAEGRVPWCLVRTDSFIERKSDTPFNKEELFAQKEGNWSSVAASERGDLCFYRFLSLSEGESSASSYNESKKQAIANEARRAYMQKLISRCQELGSIQVQ